VESAKLEIERNIATALGDVEYPLFTEHSQAYQWLVSRMLEKGYVRLRGVYVCLLLWLFVFVYC
jgi:hypothetical protein